VAAVSTEYPLDFQQEFPNSERLGIVVDAKQLSCAHFILFFNKATILAVRPILPLYSFYWI